MKRVAPIKRIRWQLGLSQEDFALRFEIPIGTLRDWEQGRSNPDRPALAYLKVIGSDPDLSQRRCPGQSARPHDGNLRRLTNCRGVHAALERKRHPATSGGEASSRRADPR